ncbi:unnamed protein product [Rhizoctonia solani]|uniref:Uncharacterized protein n=1 Tax=Rhizoctonia solani TaxID=456999 RepID=A0A8H2Y0Z3_9AGAM|nr:unnamed protein product [Rhizoctonia solani]
MGQAQTSSTWGTYDPSYETTPGTYRIVHGATNKTLQTHEVTQMLIIRDREDPSSDTGREQNDHWFIIRSGDAFIFKHCRSEWYISSLPWLPANAQLICATRYPSAWAIRTKKSSNDHRCAITIPVDWNEFRSTGSYIGIAVNSANVRLCSVPLSEKEELEHTWTLERIGGATGEDGQTRLLRQALKVTKTELAEDKAKLKMVDERLAVYMAELANARSKLSENSTELREKEEALDRAAQELSKTMDQLSEKDTKLAEKDREIFERDELILAKGRELVEKDDIIARLEEIARSSNMQAKLATYSSQNQDNINHEVSPEPELESESAPKIIKPTTQSKSYSPTTELSVKLAELGWDSD